MVDLEDLTNDVENCLDDLDFELEYETNSYCNSENVAVVEIDIDIDNDDYPDDWDKLVENAIEDVVEEWGGWYCWDGWCISVCVP